MSLLSSALCLLLILGMYGTTAIPRPGPVIGVNTACTSESIQSFCKPDNLYCVRSACSQCILRDPFNPFASFCARLIECACSISNDPQCELKVQETCY
uniref:Secreted protein n=1 Tax=Caenorhabditis tropicalis TaxID=1561998 RepID=A0A1I7USL9_9PELO